MREERPKWLGVPANRFMAAELRRSAVPSNDLIHVALGCVRGLRGALLCAVAAWSGYSVDQGVAGSFQFAFV